VVESKVQAIRYDSGSVSLDVINEFEEKFKIKFPNSFIKLISMHNGVKFVNNKFNYLDDESQDNESSISFCSFGKVDTTKIDDFQDYDVYGDEKIISFGLNGGGDYIAFDYRKNPTTDEPLVVIMYHDDFIEENFRSKMRVVKVADTFDEFLKLLHH